MRLRGGAAPTRAARAAAARAHAPCAGGGGGGTSGGGRCRSVAVRTVGMTLAGQEVMLLWDDLVSKGLLMEIGYKNESANLNKEK